ncbi:MAG: glycerol-3-phosphate dehydrogenase/oxidase [Bacteroidetes bacterium]|nr:glycerol-3-phosphate dehydrogenase/oxidase [Bacteroidota bacterium]
MLSRKKAFEKIAQTDIWDVVVIGGGATGMGIAVDAANRGFKVLLLEKNDFAKGTSSRSTKLVHGGVRYLAQGNLKLVIEALSERGFLLANAPHLTRLQAFIIPTYRYFDQLFYASGLLLYDALAGKLSLSRTKLLSKKSLVQLMPSIHGKGLKGGIVYADGQFDDARLVMSLALTANDLGGVVLNYANVTALKKNDGKVSGVAFIDEESNKTYEIASKSVINATGVFVDSILDMDDKSSPAAVMPSQGVHLVINREFFPSDHALMIPKTRDGRVLFAVPWKNAVVLGTTDTPLQEISEEPSALNEEIDFILEHFNQYNEKKITKDDIKSVFAGLRPLVKTSNNKSTALASRDHTIIVSSSNLITITGGKWTTYRKMAKDALNNAVFVAKLPIVKCATRSLRLHGYTENIQASSALSIYGSDAKEIQQMINEDVSMGERIHPDHAYTKAELIWSIRNEMALQVEDILARRSRILFVDAAAAIASVEKVASIMANELKKDNQWIQQQIALFTELAKGYLP